MPYGIGIGAAIRYAPDPTGGVAPPPPPFAPTDIAGLTLWLDAQTLSSLKQDSGGTVAVASGGDPVGYWADRSGNGNHVLQATSTRRPLYSAAGILGSKPGLSYDGVDDVLRCAAFAGGALAHPFTVYAVANVTTINKYMYEGMNGTSRAFLLVSSATTILQPNAGTSLARTGCPDVATQARCVTFLANTTSSALYVDRAQQGAIGNAGSNALDGFNAGSAFNLSGNFGGFLGEILVYSGAHDATKRGTVWDYLTTRWGVT